MSHQEKHTTERKTLTFFSYVYSMLLPIIETVSLLSKSDEDGIFIRLMSS